MPTTADYIRIADEITAEIQAGTIKPGEKLPSIAELVVKYEVSSSTIQMAYIRLEAIRIIRRHQGKGVFVTDPKTWLRPPS
jgi:GntR family transcriptional regulator